MKDNSKKRHSSQPSEMTDCKKDRIMQKVKDWQGFKYVKPLTCPHDRSLLKPKKTHKGVILKCSQCKYIQYNIPQVILKSDLSVSPTLLRNKKSNQHLIKNLLNQKD